jgi:hypothetical protein
MEAIMVVIMEVIMVVILEVIRLATEGRYKVIIAEALEARERVWVWVWVRAGG